MNPELQSFRNQPANQAAVVFIHGFGGDIRDTWKRFPEFLAGNGALDGWDIWLAGYPTRLRVDLVSLWSGDPDLEKVALRLITDARNSELKRYRSLCLIAHSMGGLVTQRALLVDKALRSLTSHVFLFGTPSAGLVKATLARFFKPQLRNMANDGEFIRGLRRDWDRQFSRAIGKSLSFRFIATAGERDEFVPAASAIGPFPPDAYPDSIATVPGNHVEMVKPDAADHPSVLLVVNGILGKAAPGGPWNAARAAVELCDFNAAIEQLGPHRAELDPAARVQLALALDSVGRREEAIGVLSEGRDDSTDAMGTLAGRLKRRWLTSRRAEDAERARNLYTEAFATAERRGDHAQAYYHGINVAFFYTAYSHDDQSAHEMASRVLEHCRQAEAGEEKLSDRRWRLATEGEAHLLLRDTRMALARYALALKTEPEPWQIASMYQQALYLAQILEDAPLGKRLKTMFRRGEA
jgi:tetratricopeptide (TPR) repeat protein